MPRIIENRIGRLAVVAAALLLPVAAAWSLSFSDGTADRVYGAANLTTAGTVLNSPDGLAFDGSGNLWVAASDSLAVFLAPTDTTAAASASKLIGVLGIDSGGAALVSLKKITITTTETDVVWVTFDSAAGGPPSHNETGGVAGLYIPASLSSAEQLADSSFRRGSNGDTLFDIIIGAGFRPTASGALNSTTPDSLSTSDSSLAAGVGGISAKESGDTITLFVADRGNNRVVGFALKASRLQNMVFGTLGDATSNDSRADLLAGQRTFLTATAPTASDGETGLFGPTDVHWCASRLLILDSGAFRVVATDFDANVDSFALPNNFAFGDSGGLASVSFTVLANAYLTDTGFERPQAIFCDGVSLAVSDSSGAQSGQRSGRVLVFTLDSDSAADNAIGGSLNTTLRTFTPSLAGTAAAAFRTLLDISGSSSLIVVSDGGNRRVLGFEGSVGSGSTIGVGGGGGTCLIEAAFTGTSLEAALPWIRGARDTVMGSAVGRFLTTAYYSVVGIAALALLIVGGAGLASAAARRN